MGECHWKNIFIGNETKKHSPFLKFAQIPTPSFANLLDPPLQLSTSGYRVLH